MQTITTKTDFRFIALMALMMSMVALGIDAMLPALQAIGTELHVQNPNDNQLIISFMFVGLSIGQLIFGPLSDTLGRKSSVYFGFVVFTIGCFLSISAEALPLMLAGRALQGFGLSAFRVVCVAIIRDQYSGNEMGRIMSFIMTVFIVVPAIAPLLGQQILHFSSWIAIFYFLFVVALIAMIWFTLQQDETLSPEDRIPFTFKNIKIALGEILTNKVSIGYTVIMGLISGSFLGFLNTSQQIFEFQYGLGDKFPYYFAAVAITVGISSIINARLVLKYEMMQITWVSLILVVIISSTAVLLNVFVFPNTTLIQFMGFLLPNIFFVGLLFGNMNSIAMNPLGKIAGIGAAVIGSLSTLLMVIIGTTIGQFYVYNTMPIIAGFGACSILALGIAYYVKK